MTTEITLFHLSAGARVHVRGQTYANTVCRKQKGNESSVQIARFAFERRMDASKHEKYSRFKDRVNNKWKLDDFEKGSMG